MIVSSMNILLLLLILIQLLMVLITKMMKYIVKDYLIMFVEMISEA